MKFNVGQWVMRPGVSSYNCEQVRQVKVTDGGTKVSLYCVCYRRDERGLDGPALTVTVSAPLPDILRVECTHFKGSRQQRPVFPLTDRRMPLQIEETEEAICITSGDTMLQITRLPCTFTFFYKGNPITGIGNRFGSSMLSWMDTSEGSFMRGQMDIGVGEKVYGLGERFTSYVKNGQVVDIWNEDGGTSSEISYKNIPFYMTNRGYGVLVNDPGPVSFEVCTEAVSRVQFSVPGEKMEFLLIGGGDMKTVLQNYTALSGKPALPPASSFGLWLSSSFTTSYDEKTVLSFVDGMRDRGIPLSVFHFDCFWMKEGEWCGFEWDEDQFPDVEGLLGRLHERGLKVCVWINPYLGQKSPVFDLAMEKGYLLNRPNGDVWQWDLWQPGLAVIDFTNPEAVAWYKENLKRLMRQGVDYFKTDFGERIPTDVVYANGADPLRMHNYYTLIYNRIVFEAIQEERGMDAACLFARSATVGGQKYPVHWGGDCNSTYPSMAESLRGGLSLCMSGFGFWSHDIGGFEGTAPADVYMRWLAFGLLSTHSRLHGSSSYRVPWLFGEKAVDVCRHFTKLKLRLMPYIFGIACECHHTGVPAMRSMALEFPGDLTAEDCDRQYMLGDALLIAPVMQANGVGEYYLPRGTWTHLLNGETRTGERWLREGYDFFSLPLFVRENTLLPMGDMENNAEYDYEKNVRMFVYALENSASRSVYTKEGQLAFTVQAEKTDVGMHIEVQGTAVGLSIALVGVVGVKSVQGATAALQDGRIVLEDCAEHIDVLL